MPGSPDSPPLAGAGQGVGERVTKILRPRTHRTSAPQTIELARELRRNPTSAEAILWAALRRRALAGFRFRRQHPIGAYVTDFFCNEASLVVEVDGPVHDRIGRQRHDRLRDEALCRHGLRLVRVRNEEVTSDLDAVLERIRKELLGSSLSPALSPGG
jgi:very-short-patch-repair endonuclease